MDKNPMDLVAEKAIASRLRRLKKLYGPEAGQRVLELEADILVAKALIERARDEIAAIRNGDWMQGEG